MSKSGIETRSGLRKRSNSRLELQRIEIGDGQRPGDRGARTSDPRPGPTGMSCAFAHWMKSATTEMRAKLIRMMTPSSN